METPSEQIIRERFSSRWATGVALAALVLGACDQEAAPQAFNSDHMGSVAAQVGHVGPPNGSERLLAMTAMAQPPTQQYNWKPWRSEEDPPSTCGTGELVTGFGCMGNYCDSVRIACSKLGGTLFDSEWSKWFSEEGPNNGYGCPGTQFMSGVACKGSYCDNLSLECTDTSLRYSSCTTVGPLSEEGGGTYTAPQGWAIYGIRCTGDYCDNKQLQICRVQ